MRAELEYDDPEEGDIPEMLRRVRFRENCGVQGGGHPADSGDGGDDPVQAESRSGDSKRPVLSEGAGGIWDIQRVSLGILQGEDDSVHGAPEGADSGEKRAFGPGERGFAETGIQVSGFGDGVRASAGLRDGQ